MKDYPYPMQARNEALCPFTRDTQLSGFLTLPKSLLCWGLSPGALLVYGLLLDRGKLSQRSGWTDKQGWVYVIFPVRELALALGKGVTTIKRWLRELEERGARAGVIWQDGAAFAWPDSIRMNLALPHSRLVEAMEHLRVHAFC